MNRDRFNDDAGLTLIELTITIGVLAIIIVPLVSSMLISLLESTSARDRVADSSTAQLISTYVLGDVQSADTITIGSAGCGSTGTAKLGMTWNDPANSDTYKVDYRRVATSDGHFELHRYACKNSGTPEDTLIAVRVDDPTTSFEATCAPTADCLNATSVTIHVIAKDKNANPNSSYAPFDFTYTATRRTA